MSTNLWTDDLLNQLRRQGDPLADDTVKVIFQEKDVEEANKFMVQMIRDDEIKFDKFRSLDGKVRDSLRHYLEESGKTPDWADKDRIKNAEKLFHGYGMIAFSLLGCASLPELYTCGKGGTQVLGMTLELEDHIARRIYETAQMIIGVMSEGGLDYQRGSRGLGIGRVQKVRLMHAAVRYLIMQDMGEEFRKQTPRHFGDVLLQYRWGEEWGVPIGQEYMGATLQTFSFVILRGLRDFGVKLPTDLENDYIHAWNVVGHHMGVDPIFLRNVTNMEEAETLYDAVMVRNRSTTPEEARDGIDLTHALMNFMSQMLRNQAPFGKIMPTTLIPRLLTQLLIGKENADLLGIRLNVWQHLLLAPFRIQMLFMGLINQEMAHIGHMADWSFKLMAQELDDMPRGPHRPPFKIPDALKAAWKLEKSSRN